MNCLNGGISVGNDEGKNNPPDRPTASFNGSLKGPGSRIGPFQIEQELGRGAMGVVYLAKDTRLDRKVAVKTMPDELMGNPIVRTRWKREAQILASLNHPNIAMILEVFEESEGLGCLILEYVSGQTLSERIAKGPVKMEEALSMALQIAEAVSAAHGHGVIHRDLKPGNIKITPEGNVKVLDFGLAKSIGTDAQDLKTTVTEPGRVIGTPAYMSPEQARGNPTDERSDIWSFGCILYEMLTGTALFEGQTFSDTIANTLGRDPDWKVLPKNMPANIHVLLRRCLEKDPHKRLQHIGDAAIEISETLSPPPTAPPATSPTLVSLGPGAAAKASLRRIAMVIGATIIVVAAIIAAWLVIKKPSLPLSKEIRLVVLPFENLGPDKDEYFAAGITDAITARLATIHGLGVISRQSAMRYKKGEKSAQQIANELRVDYILEGTVQRERPSDPNSRVRIIPQLIKASNDTHVWAQAYDNDMSEVFRVQSDMAERVAQALDITLVERERRALQSRPTENMEAYDYFLRGNEYRNRSTDKNDLKIAIQMYERAVELDPKFALAYAQLSRTHANMYWQYYDRTGERLGMAKKAVDRALQLDPDLPETHLALGNYYYNCQSDWDRALEEFAIVRKSQPNNSDLLSYIGFVQRRQGKFEEALANIKRASELDPLSNFQALELAYTFQWMRNYPEALRYFNRSISLAPDIPEPYVDKAWLYLTWEGSTQKARAVVEEALKNIRSPEESSIVDLLITLDEYEGKYQKALDRLSLKSEDIDDQDYFIPRAMRYAEIYGYMNENEMAKKYYDKGRNILEAKIRQQPDDARFHSELGIAYAGLGRREDAIREGKIGVDLLPITTEAWRGTERLSDLAQIYVMVGEFDLAIDQIEFLLSIPAGLSIPLLRLDPAWAPLREHPRFKKLLEAKE
ncbi:MAG: protein kinase [Sedimentisphaerales bacterium]|jgi:serine/threonine protein kinase/Tfp pilus assembly protein PilF